MFNFFKKKLAIDICYKTISFIAQKREKTIKEESIVLKRKYKYFNKEDNDYFNFGNDALKAYLLNPYEKEQIKLIKNDIIMDFDGLEYFLKNCFKKYKIKVNQIVAGIPLETRLLDCNLLKKSIFNVTGANSIHLVPGIIAASIGSSLSVSDGEAFGFLEIGYETSEISFIAKNTSIFEKKIHFGINQFIKNIDFFFQSEFNFKPNYLQKEKLLFHLLDTFPEEKNEKIEITGINFKKIGINSAQIYNTIEIQLKAFINILGGIIFSAPNKIAEDIKKNGIFLSGIGSLIRNLDKRLNNEFLIPINMTKHPIDNKVLGLWKIINNKMILKDIALNL